MVEDRVARGAPQADWCGYGRGLGGQDSNPLLRDQNPPCFRLHNPPNQNDPGDAKYTSSGWVWGGLGLYSPNNGFYRRQFADDLARVGAGGDVAKDERRVIRLSLVVLQRAASGRKSRQGNTVGHTLGPVGGDVHAAKEKKVADLSRLARRGARLVLGA